MRALRLAAPIALLVAAGCSDSTEVTLAKVPPVTIQPQVQKTSNIPSVHSPDVLPTR